MLWFPASTILFVNKVTDHFFKKYSADYVSMHQNFKSGINLCLVSYSVDYSYISHDLRILNKIQRSLSNIDISTYIIKEYVHI